MLKVDQCLSVYREHNNFVIQKYCHFTIIELRKKMCSTHNTYCFVIDSYSRNKTLFHSLMDRYP